MMTRMAQSRNKQGLLLFGQSGGQLYRQIACRFKQSWIVLAAFIILSLSACGGLSSQNQTADAPFVPPTLAVIIPPTPTIPAITSLRSTPTPDCQENLVYLSDLTVPDGTVFTPNAPIDKRWQVENKGVCNWDEHYHLKLTNGPDLGAAHGQALYPARTGTKAVIRILFTAPSQPGTYRSSWQAYSPDDKPFGDPIYIQIVVK